MNGLAFRLLGIPVRVEVAFLLAMAFLGWSMGRQGLLLVVWLAVAASSVLIHELGHALAFRRFGARPEVVLHGFGGYTTGAAQPPTRSILVSLAGPGVGVALGGLLLAVTRSMATAPVAPGPVLGPSLLDTALADLVFVNLGWGLFNLLPMLPLDGGNVVAAALERVTGGGGQRTARVISVITAGLLTVAAVVLRQPFVAILAGYLAFQNISALGAARDAPQMRQLDHARRLLLAGEHEAALATASEVAGQTRSPSVASAAAELQTWALLADRRVDDASAALGRAGGGVGVSQLARAMVVVAGHRARGEAPPALPLAGAFAGTGDPAAAKVAAAMVAEAGLLEDLLVGLAALPPSQAARGYEVLEVGLGSAGLAAEAGRVSALRRQQSPST